MNVDSIQNGIVIDHISAGLAFRLYNLLDLDKLDCPVAIIKNVNSRKMGKKDIVKVEVSSTCRYLHCNASTIYQTIIDGVKQKAWKLQHTTRYAFSIYFCSSCLLSVFPSCSTQFVLPLNL